MGKVSKGVKCSIEGCNRMAVRSLNPEKVKAAGLKVSGGRRAYLCKEHYKDFKKTSKKNKVVEEWHRAIP